MDDRGVRSYRELHDVRLVESRGLQGGHTSVARLMADFEDLVDVQNEDAINEGRSTANDENLV